MCVLGGGVSEQAAPTAITHQAQQNEAQKIVRLVETIGDSVLIHGVSWLSCRHACTMS